MARARAAENSRPRSKAVQIEEITRGINKFQELLGAIDDFSQEGFPYHDAARAKAELQLRECVRRIFGDRSPEFQTYRNHKLRTSNPAETAQSVAVVKGLVQSLEDKKLELQGLKPPPAAAPPAENSQDAPPQMTLVPATAQITLASPPARTTPPVTLSIAMTTNLGPVVPPVSTVPPAPPVATEYSPAVPPPVQEHSQPSNYSVPPAAAPPIAHPVTQVPPSQVERPAATPQQDISPPAAQPAPVAQGSSAVPAGPTGDVTSAPLEMHPHPPVGTNVAAPGTDVPANQQEPGSEAPLPATSCTSMQTTPPVVQPSPDSQMDHSFGEQEPLERIRKICLRFHSVARQLRLRKDYRATLEVEDDYDLQDLLSALLKVEFDEVGADEWTPPYSGGATRTTLLLHRDQIAVVVKKTRSGLTTKELADQVAADTANYTARARCTTLFCFIYDPEGRIGSPKRLETDLTSVSDRYTVEVLVAPK